MGRKILIASGTANYENLGPDLQRPELAQVVESIAELFNSSKMGYTRVLQEISSNPTSAALVDGLDEWFASVCDRSDWVVFYYTGHGELTVTTFF